MQFCASFPVTLWPSVNFDISKTGLFSCSIVLTLRKLRLVCQSTILIGYRWSSLFCGVWLPALKSFAPANLTLVSWSPKQGMRTLAKLWIISYCFWWHM